MNSIPPFWTALTTRKILLATVIIALLSAWACRNVPPSEFQSEPPSPGIEVSGVQPLTEDVIPGREIETYLAVNPTDSSNLLASSIADSANASVLYASWNGGTAWERIESPNGPFFSGLDPMVAFDGQGQAYFSSLAAGFSVWRSKDGGRTWTDPMRIGGHYDRPWGPPQAHLRTDRSRCTPPVGRMTSPRRWLSSFRGTADVHSQS